MINSAQRFLQRSATPGVNLPDVHVVGGEAPKGAGEIAQQCTARGVDDPLAVFDHETGLCRDHHVVAKSEPSNQFAHQPLGVAGPVGGCGVDQGTAGVTERLQQSPSMVGRVVSSPCHCAKPEPRYLKPAGPDRASFHGGDLSGSRSMVSATTVFACNSASTSATSWAVRIRPTNCGSSGMPRRWVIRLSGQPKPTGLTVRRCWHGWPRKPPAFTSALPSCRYLPERRR